MKFNVILVLYLSFICTSSFTQEPTYFTFDLGGVGGLGSINFEKTIYHQNKVAVAFKTGFSFMPIDRINGTSLIFPQMLHGIYGAKKHFMDVGIGLAPSFTTKFGGAYVRMPLSLGYRLQPEEKNFYWRIAYTPITSFLFDFQWQHWAGISFAYQLNSNK